MSKEYAKAYESYNAAVAKSKAGDQGAKAEKATIMADIRNMERQSARNGTVLNPIAQGKNIAVQVTETSSRRSLQEEYTRKFSAETPVKIKTRDGAEFTGTLREYHANRLLRR